MHKIDLTEDIKPLSQFRAHVSDFISQVRKTKRPIVLTQHGKSTAVILDVIEYESIVNKLETLQDIRTAEHELGQGKGVAHAVAKKNLMAKYSK